MTSSPADWAPVILALGSFLSATAGAVVVIYNALRSKRIETKIDTAAVVHSEIHDLVNGGLVAAKAKIAALELEAERLRAEVQRRISARS